jgi:ubiquinone/menaquinone biosynthesis C-methylase UbiE
MSDKRMSMARAHRLDAPERMLWLSPSEVIDALALTPGEVIADVGAGTGYFSFPMARAVFPGGRVYAVDIQRDMLSLLKNKLGQLPTSNVELVHADAIATTLPDASVDVAFMANVWHEFESHGAVLREAMRILKAHGRIAVLDWRPDVEPEHGPPLEHRLGASETAAELTIVGFSQVGQRNIGRDSWLVHGTMPETLSRRVSDETAK